MFFQTFSNADIFFIEYELIWMFYTFIKALSTTKQVQIIDQKKFVATALNSIKKVFIKHIAYLNTKILIYLA